MAILGAAVCAVLVTAVGASSAPHAKNVPVMTGIWPVTATVIANSDATGWLGPTYRPGAVNLRTWRFLQKCAGADCETDLHRATDAGGAGTRITYRGNNQFAWQESLTSTDTCGSATFTGLTIRVNFTMTVKTVPIPAGRPIATTLVAVGTFAATVNVAAYVNAGCEAPPAQITYTIRYTGSAPKTGAQLSGGPAPGLPRGTVKVPGSNTAKAITPAQQLPVGTVVDVSNGRGVTLTDGTGRKSVFYGERDGVPSKFVYAGIFQGLAELQLTGGRFNACGEKPVRRLWAKGTGKFRTRGRYASAAGSARWLTADLCTQTLVQSKGAATTVRDLVKKKTVVVKAGASYSAGP
ncbi:MAG TPA: hypothetical protein VFR32_01800 [Gaiellaceae bacterium]|nr:hypothetical protein [Gaiellaceae bacterium]